MRHALRFAVGLHGTQKYHPIVKYTHYQISSGARASLYHHSFRSNSMELQIVQERMNPHQWTTEAVKKFRNNPHCAIILGGDFNAGDIDWESQTVCEHSLNRQINKKIISVTSSSGLVQIQKDFIRNIKNLDLLCTNKPDLFSDIRSIPGISYVNRVNFHGIWR